MSKSHFIIEQISRSTFEVTVDKIVKEAEKRGWNVPATHNLQKSLAKSGKAVRPVTVIEICKPEYSGQMLELNHERIMSVMMPCRISVYVKDDGKTYTALINGAELSAGQPEKIVKVMKAASDETMEIVKTVAG